MTKALTRNDVINELEAMQLNAYTKKELEDRLNEIFGVELEFEWNTVNWGVDEVERLECSTEGNELIVPKELQGYIDIYWLPCKQPNTSGTEVYFIYYHTQWDYDDEPIKVCNTMYSIE